MSRRDTTVEEGLAESRDPAPDAAGPQPSASVPDGDLLDYLADMLLELRALADQGGQRTLSGLLTLAHVEARARRDDARFPPPTDRAPQSCRGAG